MSLYKNLCDDFYESTRKMAQTWRTESIGWQDEKAEQFSVRVIRPVSNECEKINDLLTGMDHILSRLVNVKLIDEK